MSSFAFCFICKVLHRWFPEEVKALRGVLGKRRALPTSAVCQESACQPAVGRGGLASRQGWRGTSEQYISSGIYEPVLQIIEDPAVTIQNPAGGFKVLEA